MNHAVLLKKDNRAALAQGSSSIVPLFEGFKTTHIPKDFQKYISPLKDEGFTAEKNQTQTYHDGSLRVTFIGLGKKKEFDFPALYTKMGDLCRHEIENHKIVHICCTHLLGDLDREMVISEMTKIIELSTYKFHKYKTNEKPKFKNQSVLIFLDQVSQKDKQLKDDMLAITAAIKKTRDLCNEPPNVATPEFLANYIKKDGKDIGYKVEVMDVKKIEKLGMQLMHAVGKGSPNPPHFVKATYKGDPNSKKFVALVGKGVAFDTGGVQVKPEFYMNTMKSDMGGAAAVFGTISALASIKAKVNVVAYMPFVQNMVDGNSYLPDDVYTAYNGKTVEIVHTDAEGRLVLADALSYACEEKPAEIIDVATLTGAASIAVGPKYAATLGTNQKGIDQMYEIGEKVDEPVWQLPLPAEYMDYLKSEVADLTNLSKSRATPGTIIAAKFLEQFVDSKIPWIHLDVAPVMRKDTDSGIKTGKMIGFGVNLLTEYIRNKK